MIINFFIYAVLAVFVVCSVLLVLVVLMQRPRNEGLGTAFGGGVTDTVFGAQTSDVLTKLTIWLGGIFFVCTLGLAILYSQQASSDIKEQLLAEPETTAVPETDEEASDKELAEAEDTQAKEESSPADEEQSTDDSEATPAVSSDASATESEASAEATDTQAEETSEKTN
ncbi:MAG: preprotein translocase subunit SecG [Verrucomicrobiota bacterium]